MTTINLPSERQVGHLKLIRQGRELSLAEYNVLSQSEQLDIIRHTHGKDKYDLILNTHHADKLVPQLHPQEIYLTVNELGAEDVPELLVLASPEQINLMLDMDCWDGDTLSAVLSLHWLELLLATGQEKVCQLGRELEPEVLALFLKKHLTIIHGIEVFDSDEIDNAKRLEGLYDINYASEDAAKIIGALLKIWMEQEQDSYLLIMEMIRSEQLSIFEEELYIERNNRLLDLGILPADQARSLYAHVDPDNFTPGDKPDFQLEAEDLNHPGALLAQATPANLLADILGAGINHATACELLLLVNRKMSADHVDFSAPLQVSETIQSTYDTLNLALEFLADNDVNLAEKIFNSTYLLHLFQLGHSLIEQRRKTAQQFADSSLYAFFDYQELLFIDSLLETPPCLYLSGNEEVPATLVQLKTRNDLNLVDLRLQQILALEKFFTQLMPFNLPLPDETDDELPSLAQYFITAVANQVLERGLLPLPLTRSDLSLLKNKTLQGHQLKPNFKHQLKQAFHQQLEDLDFFFEFCLELWLDSLLDFNSYDEIPASCAFIIVN